MRKKPKREDYPRGFGGEIGFIGAMKLWEEQKTKENV